MKREIKILFQITAAIICCLFSCNCTSASIERPNGDKLKFASVGTNYNITTKVNDASDTNILPLPIGGGKLRGTDSLEPKEGTQKWAVMIGGNDGIKVGMQDQGTPMGIFGKWAYKMERAFLVFKGITSITGDYFKNKSNETAAGVANTKVKSDAKSLDLQTTERAKVIPDLDPEMVPITLKPL